jgi:DNA-binding NarL/FixJ family response regulator
MALSPVIALTVPPAPPPHSRAAVRPATTSEALGRLRAASDPAVVVPNQVCIPTRAESVRPVASQPPHWRGSDHAHKRPLTERERQVVELIRPGLTNAEIAERLRLSSWTVKRHVARALAKTGCRRRVDLAIRYESIAEPSDSLVKAEPTN